jgi:hypothetical protein
MSLFEAFAAKARLFSPEVGQQMLAKWLAKDKRGRIGPNMAKKIAGCQRVWETEYSKAMRPSLISESKSSPNEGVLTLHPLITPAGSRCQGRHRLAKCRLAPAFRLIS